MKAAVITALGLPPAYQDFPEPVLAEGETLVRVAAAAITNIARMRVAGTHYSGHDALPAVAGLDGVGHTDDGTRVYFGAPREPYGSMAELVAAPARFLAPVPNELDTVTAAALPNAGVSAWLSLAHTGGLTEGQDVLIMGATGVTGRLAVQCAKLQGARRVVAVGRNQTSLDRLAELGADATVRLDDENDLAEQLAAVAGDGFDLVIDYLWGAPAEALITSLSRGDLGSAKKRTRLVQVGEMAGSRISLPAGALRSSGLEIVGNGTGNLPAPEVLRASFAQVLAAAVRGDLVIDVEAIPLSDVTAAWHRNPQGTRLVLTLTP
ncbi:quinone oxidoreductase family protein [Microlunatus speluncae]|uniref:quinone oxidoreductase family protein n=1 Tax=Microlunatus speluncae TaxID=2594267 RepID=UPI00126644FF|nr:zinc-binding alcohol dehydrogenase family protein [Microlunatus speluncae]